MWLLSVLCTRFCCNTEELQELLETRDGRYKASKVLLQYKLGKRGSLAMYEFKGFARFEKLPTILENEVLHFTRLPDILLREVRTGRSTVRPHPLTCVNVY